MRTPLAEGPQEGLEGGGQSGDMTGARDLGVGNLREVRWSAGAGHGEPADGQDIVLYSESRSGPHEGMEHKSDVLRSLQLMCREWPGGHQSRSWGPARMDGKAGAGPSGSASSSGTARAWVHTAIPFAFGFPAPAKQCPWLSSPSAQQLPSLPC